MPGRIRSFERTILLDLPEPKSQFKPNAIYQGTGSFREKVAMPPGPALEPGRLRSFRRLSLAGPVGALVVRESDKSALFQRLRLR